jgi:hypothetical protein
VRIYILTSGERGPTGTHLEWGVAFVVELKGEINVAKVDTTDHYDLVRDALPLR